LRVHSQTPTLRSGNAMPRFSPPRQETRSISR
jgi:hypothetical protein